MSEVLSLYEILKASKTGIAPDMWTALAGKNWNGTDTGYEVKELTGIPPLSIRSNDTILLDYLISGNMEQASGVSHTTPIQPSECGERTGNLYNINAKDVNNGYVNNAQLNQDGTTAAWGSAEISEYIPISGDTAYTFNGIGSYNSPCYGLYDENKQLIGAYRYNGAQIIKFTSPNNARYFRFTHIKATVRAMMVEGEYTSHTMPAYEPYGYKIPISSGGENLYGGTDISGTINNTYYKNDFIYSNIAQGTYTLAFDLTTETPSSQTYASSIGVGETTYSKDIQIQSGKSDGHFVFTFTIEAEDAGKNLYARFARHGVPVTIAYTASNIMLNLGSTAKPYVPYNRTTTPIYLGEVETTRRIKKLVLTGEEFVYVYANADIAFRINTSDAMLNYRYCVCTHFSYQRTPGHSTIDGVTAGAGDYNLYFTFSSSSATQFGVVAGDTNSFKSFLQQQYAAGTPVTVWYVLAEPTTGVVNEPLRKIGDYADTVSYEQAGVQIPTNRGNTVIDVETTLKPSQMYIKYKG